MIERVKLHSRALFETIGTFRVLHAHRRWHQARRRALWAFVLGRAGPHGGTAFSSGGEGVCTGVFLRVSAVRLYFATLFGLLRINLSSAKVVPK